MRQKQNSKFLVERENTEQIQNFWKCTIILRNSVEMLILFAVTKSFAKSEINAANISAV
jgi:hypothetical protein